MTPPKASEKELKIEFKRYLLEQGIQLIDLSEYAEKGIANWWLSKLDSLLESERKEIAERVENLPAYICMIINLIRIAVLLGGLYLIFWGAFLIHPGLALVFLGSLGMTIFTISFY